MPRRAAGLLMYRRRKAGNEADGIEFEVLLAHPGGPFWKYKDAGAWTIPKGEYDDDENPLDAAKREFEEETGCTPPHEDGPYIDLGEIRQKGGKLVRVWAVEGDFDPANLCSNEFELEYPPKSGKYITIPEVDRVEWFSPEQARAKIKGAQWPLVERLLAALK